MKNLQAKLSKNLYNGQPSSKNTTRLIKRDAQRENNKLHSGSFDNTMVIWRSKKFGFQKNYKKVFNQLNM